MSLEITHQKLSISGALSPSSRCRPVGFSVDLLIVKLFTVVLVLCFLTISMLGVCSMISDHLVIHAE